MDDRSSLEQSRWRRPTRHQLFIMITLAALSLMVSLDASIIVTSLNAIIVSLQIDTTQGFWIATSYLLANTIGMPLIAAMSDIYGRRKCLFTSLCLFTIGSLMCSLADNITLMLMGRCFQGVGGGGIIILSLITFTDIVPLHCRPKWYGIVLGAWALGNCAGPTIGGAIAQYASWRWVFYLMFPFCAFGLVAILLMKETGTPRCLLREFDWVGCVLFTASITLFLIAISWGGLQYSWKSAQTIAPLCTGLLGLIATSIYEVLMQKSPFLSVHLLRSWRSTTAYICGMFQGLLLYGQLYYIPFYFQSVQGYSSLRTGIALLPVMVTLVPASVVTGFVVTHTKNYTYPIWIGWALASIATGLTLLWDTDTPIWEWAIVLVLLGLGHGAILNAQNFATQAMCGRYDAGLAAALYGFLRQFGMPLGVAIGSAVFQNSMSRQLQIDGIATDIALHSESFIAELPYTPYEIRSQILKSYVAGFHAVYAVFTAIAGAAFCLSLLIVPGVTSDNRQVRPTFLK